MKAKNNIALKINRKIKVFFLFLLLSAIFWFFSALSEKYTYNTEFSISYKNIPSNLLFQESPPTKIQAQIDATGFKILSHKLGTKNIDLDLSKFNLKNKNTYYFLPNNQLDLFQEQLQETKIRHFDNDSIILILGKLITKKIPIKSKIKLNFEPGFKLTEYLIIKPDSILIKGPKNIIDSIDFIVTDTDEINLIKDNFTKKVNLILPETNSKLSFDTKEAIITGKVAKFTQGQLEVPIHILNIPQGVQMELHPKTANIKYQVTFENYQKITSDSFTISCNYPISNHDSITAIPIFVSKKPDFITEFTITPQQITYLLKK
jgi:YbbR domain-containing protein